MSCLWGFLPAKASGTNHMHPPMINYMKARLTARLTCVLPFFSHGSCHSFQNLRSSLVFNDRRHLQWLPRYRLQGRLNSSLVPSEVVIARHFARMFSILS